MKGPTAILLVAGVGSRLRPLTDRVPKCLIDLGGETILARAVRLLAMAGVSRLVLSTGHLEARVREALASCPLPVDFVSNPDHAQVQNMVSLHRALGAVSDGEVIKLDGDLVFAPGVLERVLSAPGPASVAIDGKQPPRAEAMKVQARDGQARRFGKGLDPAECAGESIGMERFDAPTRVALARALARSVDAGRTDLYYEDVYNDLLQTGLAMHCVPVTGLPWTEVDDEEDLARARALVAAG